MARFSPSFLVAALFLIATTAFGNEIQHIAAPMTHLVLNDRLVTSIHTGVQRLKGAGYFSGKVVGKYEKMGGDGWYNGNFRGSTSSASKSTKTTFDYKFGGMCKSMGFNAKYDGKVNGKMIVHGRRARVYAGYETSARGTVHGKLVKGTAKGNAVFTAAHNKFFYRERGSARMYVGHKLITAKYTATLNKHTVNVAVYGLYNGKKFFVKYSFSLNLLPLAIDANPMMIKRTYGTVTITVNGKTRTQKFDVTPTNFQKLI